MQRHRVFIIALLTCLFVTASSTPLESQASGDLTALREQVARDAELLDKARELVVETNSAKARLVLEAATKLHRQSMLLVASVTTNTDFARAALVTKKAREAILHTIALAKREAKFEENASKAIERAENRLEQTRKLISEHDGREVQAARKLAGEAHGQLQRSRNNMREHLFEVALRLAVSSEQLSRHAIKTLRRDSADVSSVEREIEQTQRVLDRIGERMAEVNKHRAQQMYQESRELQMKAKQRLRDGERRTAFELTQEARRIAATLRATELTRSTIDRQNVERALRLTDALILEARTIATRQDTRQLSERIERADKIQARATNHFERGDDDKALKMTKKARVILKDSLSAIKRELRAEDIQSTLRETDEILVRLKEAVGQSEDALANELFARAQSKQRRAWKEFEEEKLRAALANTRLARRLANRSFRQLGNERI